jgi:hypothetical protein
MQNLGMAVGLFGILLAGILLFRGIANKSWKQFPIFYSYIGYTFCWSILMYGVYWLDQPAYPTIYWFTFLINILVEFSVLVEISDHIFRNLAALRYLGRAITIAISAVLAVTYILPSIIHPPSGPSVLLAFNLRVSVTKVIVLAVLFLAARRYRSKPERSVVGLMLGFSIYLGISIAYYAASVTYGDALYRKVLWIMTPLAFTLCLLVWIASLWDSAPAPTSSMVLPATGREPQAMALELARFNNELSKFTEK